MIKNASGQAFQSWLDQVTFADNPFHHASDTPQRQPEPTPADASLQRCGREQPQEIFEDEIEDERKLMVLYA
jgi:hypothetical protein